MATVYIKQIDKNDYKSQAEYKDACAENLEAAIKLLRKKISNEGILKEYMERTYYTSKGEERRKAKKIGRRKAIKKMYRDRRYND